MPIGVSKYTVLIFLSVFGLKMMAQSDIIIENNKNSRNVIIADSEHSKNAALILKSYLDRAFYTPCVIEQQAENTPQPQIHLHLSDKVKPADQDSFTIRSDNHTIYLSAANEKYLRYAVYTLLERWGFRKFTAGVMYIPETRQLTFPVNTTEVHKPSFEYRDLFYPDAFDEEFRDWHKLDWHINDFGIWGHSFDRLIPVKDNFTANPLLFALYEGKRRTESLCMTNDTVVALVEAKMKQIIAKSPDAQFYSVSQNDDVIYCESAACRKLNEQYGGPQGSLYYFLNKIATRFPKTRISTLAYLHTYRPPVNMKIAPNIYTIFCPIELDRGKPLIADKAFMNTLNNWSNTAPHLYLWDYTVQFSNYLSPFPNLHTFSDNYKLFRKNNVKGLFVQGYADVPGDFTELRQYLLAKLLWDTEIDVEAVADDFLRGFYGKAAPLIKEYLLQLTREQQKANQYLDIYSGPVQSRNTFLSPENMDHYDQLIDSAVLAVEGDAEIEKRISKIRLSLEYVYFEQSKFYGKDEHGMFVINKHGDKEVRKGLTERVLQFSKECAAYGIYELSEDGLSPEKYYLEWLVIAKNTVSHKGEGLMVNFLSKPAEDLNGKGSYGLVDGNRGYKDFNINWIGWYGTNPEIEITTSGLDFKKLKINFLNDQRHWIFPPKKVSIYGLSNEGWELIQIQELEILTENYTIKADSTETVYENFSKFTSIKILIDNQEELPIWRKRKNKKPMVMIDEIELY